MAAIIMGTSMGTATIMADANTVIRLQSWLSPAFPTGSFSYSHGLEAAIAEGWVTDEASLQEWLSGLVQAGPGWNDCVLLAESWHRHGNEKALFEIAILAKALCFSRERLMETTSLGDAFLKAAQAWAGVPNLSDDCPLPVAVGACAGATGVDLVSTLVAFLNAYVSNQIQAALRLMKLGQQGGVEILARMEPLVLETAAKAENSTLEDLASNTVMADIAAMKHETLTGRMFVS